MPNINEKSNSGYISRTLYKGFKKHFFYFGRGIQDDYQETMEKSLCYVGTTYGMSERASIEAGKYTLIEFPDYREFDSEAGRLTFLYNLSYSEKRRFEIRSTETGYHQRIYRWQLTTSFHGKRGTSKYPIL